jgi:excisionase family DNA binding protein
MGEESLWTARDVAAFLRVSRSWVYLHAEAGTLPSVRIGGLRRFVPAAIRTYATGERDGASVVPLRPPRSH